MSNELYRVVCDDYRSHPTSYGQCLALLRSIEEDPRQCQLEHSIEPYVSLGQILLTQPPPEHAEGPSLNTTGL